MFYTAGEQYGYSLIYTVANAFFEKPAAELDLVDFQRAMRRYLAAKQPWLAPASRDDVEFCDDPAIEDRLLAALHKPSPLDDLPHYRSPEAFKTSGRNRARIAADSAHAKRSVEANAARDPAFWEIFGVYTTHVVCVDSKYSYGGTNSNALGVIYLVNPRALGENAFYELCVHEATHLMMFIDERRQRHYRDYAALEDPDNFCVSAVYEMARPLDKVLHSLVVATEVLLHRERVLGQHGDTKVHPATPKLAHSSLVTADALLDLQARRQLLAPRGAWLVERCREHLVDLVRRHAPAKVA